MRLSVITSACSAVAGRVPVLPVVSCRPASTPHFWTALYPALETGFRTWLCHNPCTTADVLRDCSTARSFTSFIFTQKCFLLKQCIKQLVIWAKQKYQFLPDWDRKFKQKIRNKLTKRSTFSNQWEASQESTDQQNQKAQSSTGTD